MKIAHLLGLAGSVLVPLAGGFVGGLLTKSQIKGWYRTLRKVHSVRLVEGEVDDPSIFSSAHSQPSWNPPNWVFAPVWSALYASMGTAAWLVWRSGGLAKNAVPLGLYAGQLALNFAWTPLFFAWHRLDLSLVDIVAMWAGIAGESRAYPCPVASHSWLSGERALPCLPIGCVKTFRPVSVTASNLMIPYLAWVTYATALNLWILVNNKRDPESGETIGSPAAAESAPLLGETQAAKNQ